MKTIRLIAPIWQGGVNPDYYFGAELLSHIVPPSNTAETFKIVVDDNFEKKLPLEDGTEGKSVQIFQIRQIENILKIKSPDKIIVLGGDCSISQAPFDYLSGKYGKNFGIIWLDAHPDISTVEDTTHNHEMILATLIAYGKSDFIKEMKNPVEKNRVIYAGLIEKELRHIDRAAKELGIKIAPPEDLKNDSEFILKWISENKIEKIAVHFDLDVLDREDFRSNTCAKPHTTKKEYGAAMGELYLNDVIRILSDVDKVAEIVGLAIAEHMPYDAINLRNGLSKLNIFK
ncbi:MAG: arginase family protein [Selenomonadaceae bacterium]|nr:arginase family protein [Selenomonadaceae bacterium]